MLLRKIFAVGLILIFSATVIWEFFGGREAPSEISIGLGVGMSLYLVADIFPKLIVTGKFVMNRETWLFIFMITFMGGLNLIVLAQEFLQGSAG